MINRADQLEQLCWEIRRTFRDLVKAADRELRPLEIQTADRALLEFLAREPEPISISDLARRRSVSRQHIHKSLRELPNRKWVRQSRSREDRREIMLSLSPEGLALWKRVRRIDIAFFTRMSVGFGSDEMAAARQLLVRFRQELDVVGDGRTGGREEGR